jgi:GR25 family glycosyltransferase involved in LPS biosynthesis
MECFYINLDEATERKSSFENNFLKNKKDQWHLSRFTAINSNYVETNKIKGGISNSNKACNLSHKFVIKKNLDSKVPVFIMEDDTIIGKETSKLIDATLDSLAKNKSYYKWDILYTDVCISDAKTIIELIYKKKNLSKKKKFELLDLSKIKYFAGLSAYILNPNSIKKIYKLINQEESFNLPLDLYIRKLIHLNKLKGFVIFPFVTSLSKKSLISQIASTETSSADLIWNTFRMMIWTEKNIETYKPLLEKIKQIMCDEESNQFGTIISSLISNKFTLK